LTWGIGGHCIITSCAPRRLRYGLAMPDDLEARVERIVKARRRAMALLLLALVGSIATTVGGIFWLAARHRRAAAAIDAPASKMLPEPAPTPAAHDAPASNSAGHDAPASNSAPASVSGVVRLRGTPPPRAPLKMSTDPYCARKTAEDESAIVGAGGALQSAIVHVVGGPSSPPPADKVTLDQDGCRYRPRVVALQVGQTLQIRNSDETLHNIHGWIGARTIFNNAHVAHAPPIEKTFNEPGIIKLKCDVHQWMGGFVLVQPNGFFAVTGADGRFTLRGLPAGRYTVEAWHERFGARTVELTLAAGAAASADFELSPDGK
jgi:plastocyanin